LTRLMELYLLLDKIKKQKVETPKNYSGTGCSGGLLE